MQKVTIYTTSWCSHCHAAKKFLQEHKIKYEEYDVESDDDKWKEAMKKADGKDIVPVVEVGGKVVYGRWQEVEPKLKEWLNVK